MSEKRRNVAGPDPIRLPERLPKRLADAGDAGRLVGVCFDFLVAQPVSRFVTPAQVLEHIETALRPSHVRRVLIEHLPAALERDRERARAREDRIEAYLTPEALELFRRLAAGPVRLNPEILEGLVKQDAVRHMVRVMVEETLGRFVQMLKPAVANGPLGKGLFARLGAQMETQLSKAATGFVSTSLDFLLGRLAHVLATPETRRQLARLRAEGLEAGLKLRTSALWDLAQEVDLEEVLAVVPGLVEHNLGRPEIRELILAEAAAALDIEGARTLGELLEPDAVAAWRARCVEVAGPLLAELVQTAPFERWLAGR
jgi:hypothetical protein